MDLSTELPDWDKNTKRLQWIEDETSFNFLSLMEYLLSEALNASRDLTSDEFSTLVLPFLVHFFVVRVFLFRVFFDADSE